MGTGRHDSSKTRVAPIFRRLLDRDPSGQTWLPKLVDLPTSGSVRSREVGICNLKGHDWAPRERALFPPLSLLSWLVRNLKQPSNQQTERIDRRRLELIAGNPATIEQAMSLLRTGGSKRKWYVLEGTTYPDAFLSTDEVVVVIEGKRTEAGPTTATTWMPVRHQILRHLDCAYEILGHRRLLGFFVVEADSDGQLPKLWLDACKATTSRETLMQSLPHRSELEKSVIADAFLGATTWQRICKELEIPYESLPDVAT
jgi:hypothetical protein